MSLTVITLKQVFHSLVKIKDLRNEFGKCVNSVIFIAHSALVFLYDYQHFVKALAREYLWWGRNNSIMAVP